MNSSRNNIITITDLNKSFNLADKSRLEVLENISFAITAGSFTTFIGPSGCGKSTLFNILSGIEDFDTGQVLIENQIVANRKGIFGYMFQDDLLFPWFTTGANVAMSFQLIGVSKKESLVKAYKLLKQFSLERFFDFYPQTLSGGMRQKVALLRTIAFNSKMLLLDEPFGSLDAISRKILHDYLLSVWEKFKSTILFTTHDIEEAILLSDEIFVFSKRPAKIIKKIKIDLPRPRLKLRLNHLKILSLELKLEKLLK